MKKLIPHKVKRKTIKRIYLVIYDQQEYLGFMNTNVPTKAFKSKKHAEVYAASRNFEFQIICLQNNEEIYENYILNNNYSDFFIQMSELRDTYSFIKEEMHRLQIIGKPADIWDILRTIVPFRVMHIEYITELKNT